MLSWYLIERACFSPNLGVEQIADDALGSFHQMALRRLS